MAHIFREGDVTVHIQSGFEPEVLCYDLRDELFRTVVVIDLLTFLPATYGDDQDDNQIPHWKFVIAAMTICANRGDELWEAWDGLKNEPFV